MAFNISDFRNSFKNGEPASPTNYEVTVYRKPRILTVTSTNQTPSISNVDIERDLKYRCITCSMPGKALNTSERSTYGPTRKIANSAMYQDVVFSYIVSDNMGELQYFNEWLNSIVYNTEITGASVNDVAYYDDYVGEVFITQYNKSGIPTRKIKLIEAYPIFVNEIPLGWEMNNDYIKIEVTFAYRRWETLVTPTQQYEVPINNLDPTIKKTFNK